MCQCDQTENLSILDHGILVSNYFKDLYNHLKYGSKLKFEWKLQSWLYENKDLLLSKLLPLDILETYHIYHDCGKPFCLLIENGKRHFPDHAEMSSKIWTKLSECPQICKLISMDMDIHKLKSDVIEEFASRSEAASLLLTGLAEIHANAKMFGGLESTSFKIKWKHLNNKGKKICQLMA